MSRHSKHSNDRSFYSYQERKDAGYVQTKKEVLGTDAFLPFGYCAISLKAPKNPVATPEGWIYDREFILEYILNKKLELQAQQKKFEEQERRKASKAAAKQRVEDNKDIAQFLQGESAIISSDYRHKRALDADAQDDADPAKKLRKGEMLNVDKQDLRKHSFWTKEYTPNAAPAELKSVDTTVKCPMSGKKLKAKDLIPIKFEVYDPKMIEAGGARGCYCCAVSKQAITHQQAILIKPTGIVVLESVLKDCVLKDMKCPLTGKKIEKKDLLKLQQGGTGFSAHNEVEAKSSSTIRSFGEDASRAGGHLPKAGFVGLR
eukprot:TRINITY_DN73336_c0_g1_i1.p2 TRINITY_DN73336_c0_g1~~TRINITY_DN73336_c0_g1_i1.p2  ORF type:complete len:317 (-),score=98.09 TRINITY_DN73336_c0_g1_i1:127-1077(-)